MSASCVTMMTSPGVSESSLGMWTVISWLPLDLLLSIIVLGGVIWGLFSWRVTRKTVELWSEPILPDT
ncbi:MAG TPA: hypothetical protein VEL31_26365 [Ktedonobacteraceae bacterium]|nr:hypothetical protein [Ktedonobacteraceae bacterium]